MISNNVIVKKMPSDNTGYENASEVEKIVCAGIEQFFLLNYGKPIDKVIKAGDKVVLKPNFVAEMNFNVSRRHMEMENPNDCFITHVSVLKAVLKVLSTLEGIEVMILESPMQFCRLEKIVTEEMWADITGSFRGTIRFVDLRRTIMYLSKETMEERKTNVRSLDNYVDFNLGNESMHLSKEKYCHRFRVTDYPPKEMKNFHEKGKHVYRIAKEVIDADWIFNLPKLKTHMKSGITGAMKNFVGVVGNKECLPHHIKGSPLTGGDCHGDISFLKFVAENFLDIANSFLEKNRIIYLGFWYMAHALLKLKKGLTGNGDLSGSWSGNDTIWRTVYDLNTCIYYGKVTGEIAEEPQRNIITLTDAIVSGQKEGPMNPWPSYTNAITIGNSTFCVDLVNAALMNFDEKKLLHYDEVLEKEEHKIWNCEEPVKIYKEDAIVSFEELKETDAVTHEMPPRW